MVTILLEQIIEILKGWLSSFTSWAEDVAEKLGLIEEATEYIDDIYDDTTAIKDNTSSIVDSNTLIQGYSLNISNKTNNIDSNVTAIKNNVGSIATSSGAAAAFTEDIATNTLNIDNRLVTIGSDTTQIRSNSNTITADVSDIKSMLNYFSYGFIITEDIEGALCSFDTDLIDYLQNLNITINPDANGFSAVSIIRCGKNLLNVNYRDDSLANTISFYKNIGILLPAGTYTLSTSEVVNWYVVDYVANTNLFVKYNSNFITFTLNQDTKVWFNTYKVGINHNDLFQLEIGDEINEFESYTGNTYTVSLGQTVTDGGELNALTGVLKVNTTPPTYSVVDPIAVKTFNGINNIWADTGDSMVTYKETLKHKIDKEA